MDMLWSLFGECLLFYLVGSVSMAMLVVYILTGRDIRYYGDEKASITNVWRVLGPEMAVLTMLGELVKGYLVVWIAEAWFPHEISVEMCLCAAVIGKMRPCLANQGQGSGILVSIGGLYGLNFPGIQLLTACLLVVTILGGSKRKAEVLYGLVLAAISLFYLPSTQVVWGLVLASAQIELKSYKQLSQITPWANNIKV